ncbi:MAG TPA: hypothetical protein VIV11_26255, partial [Kofleriaceae bacterium]
SGDDEPMPDGPPSSALDPADCTPFAQSLATAAMTCGTSLPAGGQAAFEGWCKKGVASAAMCGGNPGAGLDCFASPDPKDWICLAGEPYPACNGDLAAALGALCVVALGNPQCASGVKCTYDADCSTGLACNSRTNQCMSKNAYCVGLPCTYDADCPTGHRCNSTENACIAD